MTIKTKAKSAVVKKAAVKKPAKTKRAEKPAKTVKTVKTPAKKPSEKPVKIKGKISTPKAAKAASQAKKQPAEDKIKEAQKKDMLLIGTKTVLKAIKNGKAVNVFYAVNIPEKTMKDIEYYAGISGIGVDRFNGNSAKLGEFCGKPFRILLTAIKK